MASTEIFAEPGPVYYRNWGHICTVHRTLYKGEKERVGDLSLPDGTLITEDTKLSLPILKFLSGEFAGEFDQGSPDFPDDLPA